MFNGMGRTVQQREIVWPLTAVTEILGAQGLLILFKLLQVSGDLSPLQVGPVLPHVHRLQAHT